MASTPTFDASAIAIPATADAAFEAVRGRRRCQPLLDRATLGRYVPGLGLQDRDRDRGPRQSARSRRRRPTPQQPGAEEDGLVVGRFTDPRRPPRVHRPDARWTCPERPRCRATSGTPWPASHTGGASLDAYARRLGFGAPIPFDLPTATSQLTNGGGPLPGGFADDVELANAAYGQGEVLVTPLQMALVAAAVANGGELMKPRLVTSMIGLRTARGRRSGRASHGTDPRRRRRRHGRRRRCRRPSRASSGRLFTDGAKVPGVPDGGQVGHGPARRIGRAALVVHRLRPGRRTRRSRSRSSSRRAAAVAERAAPLAGRMLAHTSPHGHERDPRADTPARRACPAGRTVRPAEPAPPATRLAHRRCSTGRSGRCAAAAPPPARRAGRHGRDRRRDGPPVRRRLRRCRSRSGEPFLGLMAAIGTLMTAWVGLLTLVRG